MSVSSRLQKWLRIGYKIFVVCNNSNVGWRKDARLQNYVPGFKMLF